MNKPSPRRIIHLDMGERLPTKERSQKEKEKFSFATGRSSLGLVMVVTSELGIVSVLIGKDQETLLQRLQDRFPKVLIKKNGVSAKLALPRVMSFIKKPSKTLDLPLDMRGTSFQQRVWKEARKIPLGETSTYSEIAQKVGSPRAMRAVGSACTNNHFSIIIPCHRVLRKTGTSSEGFWKGSKRQQFLITREKKRA